MAFKPFNPITQVNGYAIKPGYYGSFVTSTPEEARQALIESWSTPEQRAFNAAHKECPRCHGRGYTRKDQRVGCHVCRGTGSVPK